MTFQLPAGTEQVTHSNELPVEFGGLRIPGAITTQGSTDACRILVQEIPRPLYKINYYVFHFFKNLSFAYSSESEGLHTHAALENNAQHTFQGMGRMNILEGQYTALWGSNVTGKTHFEENADYRMFDISYSPNLVAEWADSFPRLAEAISSGKPFPLSKNPRALDGAMRDCIQRIFKCKINDANRANYFDAKVREYLLLGLDIIYNIPQANYRFSPSDREKIVEAKRLLLLDISKHGYTIQTLAKAVGLNEHRLKTGFKYYFECAVHEALTIVRMETAKELLRDMPMKEVSRLVGYTSVSSFMHAIKKYFGHPAGQLRKK